MEKETIIKFECSNELKQRFKRVCENNKLSYAKALKMLLAVDEQENEGGE